MSLGGFIFLVPENIPLNAPDSILVDACFAARWSPFGRSHMAVFCVTREAVMGVCIQGLKGQRDKLYVLLSVLLVPGLAWCEDVKAPPGSFFHNLGVTASVVITKVLGVSTATLTGTAKGYAGSLVPVGLGVGGALALCYFFWQVFHYLATGRGMGGYFQILLDVGIPACLAGTFISGYTGYVSSLDSGLDAVRNIAGDTGSMLSNLQGLYEAVFRLVDKAFEDAFTELGQATQWNDQDGMTGEVAGGLGMPKLGSDFLLALSSLILTGIFCIVVIVVAMIGLAEIAGLVLMGPFLFAVGIAFGPLFIAGIVTPWTREYLSKWLGFMVSAALLTGVLNIIVGLASHVVGGLDLSAVTSDVQGGSAVQMAIIAVLLMAFNSLVSQAPAVASAMVPGTIGARSGAGGAISGIAGAVAGYALGSAKTAAGANQTRWNSRYEMARRADWKAKHNR